MWSSSEYKCKVNTLINHSLQNKQDSVFRWARRLSCRPVGSCQQQGAAYRDVGTSGVTAALVNSRRRSWRRQGQQSHRPSGRVERSRMTSSSSPLLPEPLPLPTTVTKLSWDRTSPRLVLARRGAPPGPLALFTWITVIPTGTGKVQPHRSERWKNNGPKRFDWRLKNPRLLPRLSEAEALILNMFGCNYLHIFHGQAGKNTGETSGKLQTIIFFPKETVIPSKISSVSQFVIVATY